MVQPQGNLICSVLFELERSSMTLLGYHYTSNHISRAAYYPKVASPEHDRLNRRMHCVSRGFDVTGTWICSVLRTMIMMHGFNLATSSLTYPFRLM